MDYKNFKQIMMIDEFTMWFYKTNSNIEDVLECGYFNEAFALLNRGDIILVKSSDKTTFIEVTGIKDHIVNTFYIK